MSNGKGGGPAFPTDEYFDETLCGQTTGMSLRDYFASHALAGLLSDHKGYVASMDVARNAGINTADQISAECYELADAMIEARKI
jgi:hypothetical protein